MHKRCRLAGHHGAAIDIAFHRAAKRTSVHALELVGVGGGIAFELAHRAGPLVLQAAHRVPTSAARHHRVGIFRLQHAFLIRIGDAAFLNRKEAGAHLHALGAQRKRGRHATAVGDAARRDHGDAHGIAYARDERHSGELANVATGLAALGNHRVGAHALHARSERRRRHHGNHLYASLFPGCHEIRRAARARGNHVDAQLGEQLRHLGRLRIHEHDVCTEGSVASDFAGNAHLFFDPREWRAATGDNAQAARRRHRTGEFAVGDAGHGALDDGHANAQKICYAGVHTSPSFVASRRGGTARYVSLNPNSPELARTAHWAFGSCGTRAKRIAQFRYGKASADNSLGMYALFQAVDVVDQLANRVEALSFAELDVKAILDLAHKLNHVERIDTERLERGVGGNGSGVDVEVLVQDLLDGFESGHFFSLSNC